VKYFASRKIGSSSELLVIDRKDVKKCSGVMRTIGMEERFENQLSKMKASSDRRYKFKIFVAFGTATFDDKLLTSGDLQGDDHDQKEQTIPPEQTFGQRYRDEVGRSAIKANK